jgi:serine/threonine protein kinase
VDIESQLLFAVLALQLELIDPLKLADVCAGWAVRRDKPLSALMAERGWLTAEDCREVDRLLERKLRKHGGDACASLHASIDSESRAALLQVNDPVVDRSLERVSGTERSRDKPSQKSTEPAPVGSSATVDYIPPVRRFRTLDLHGQGGQGLVFRTRDEELQRQVALKRLKPEIRDRPESLSQFYREALITGQLEHPNIVPVYDLGRDPVVNDPFYVMKLVEGRKLRDVIREHHNSADTDRTNPTERRRLLGALVQVGQALAYAHARGVLHLDLKPSNVVLGKFGEVIVLDWGLARLHPAAQGVSQKVDPEAPTLDAIVLTDEARSDAIRRGRVQGTPEYMAPEQAEVDADRIDERADVFGLGAILFEILTGRAPRRFQGEPFETLLERIRIEPLPRSKDICGHVPAALDAICAHAMAPDPAQRIANVPAFVAELENWLADEPLIAYREIVSGFEKTVSEHPEVSDYREQLARNRANLGLVLEGLGRHRDAEAAYKSAISDYETLVAAHPLLPGHRADLAATRSHLARTLQDLGRDADAKASRTAAQTDYEALAAAHPQARDFATGLASVYLSISMPVPKSRTLGFQDSEPPSRTEPETREEDSRDPETVTLASPDGQIRAPRVFLEYPVGIEPLGNRGRLEIRRELGRGGLGAVYLAFDADLNREVAVKIVGGPTQVPLTQRQRFLREAQIAANLEHPHIVPIYGLGYRTQDGSPFMTLRFIQGSTLSNAIRKYRDARGPNGRHTRELRSFIQWLIDVSDALSFAHGRGIIHRDPKPSNVLIATSGEALLTDWGLAKVVAIRDSGTANSQAGFAGIDLTQDLPEEVGTVVGTPAYMAPEQARGDTTHVDSRTDTYVVGASLYQILTGWTAPHSSESRGVRDLLKAILAGPVPRARSVDRSVPHELDAICARAMAFDPNDRYPSALDLKRDLEGWLHGGPIAAYPESRIRRAWRRLRLADPASG